MVNTPILAHTSVNKLVKFNAGVILLFIMAKDYEHKPNLLELFTISLKIMGIFHYKRHGAPEWKLCEVFYKYPMEIICYGYRLKTNIMTLLFYDSGIG